MDFCGKCSYNKNGKGPALDAGGRKQRSVKILILGAQERYEKYMPALPLIRQQELVFLNKAASEKEILAAGADAEILFADAIMRIPGSLIEKMPNLKLIQSEGVGFNGFDLETAKRRGIYVCNNRGCNSGAVAEQAIFLMLALLRGGMTGDRAVRQGRQMEVKEQAMVAGISELGDCSVGLYGFGDIARATAERLRGFGSEVFYYSLHRKSEEEEKQYHVTYLPKEELTARCDFVSLHCAVTDQTRELANAAFFASMKASACLINTARGDLVDNDALRAAILSGAIAGAGLDVLSPEPVSKDHPLLTMPAPYCDRMVLSPHVGGITEGSFRRAHLHMWRNAEKIVDGHRPDAIVNGL
jgi:lactate dehydrogenase-like 2-hydroxyacid dehydrogenase